MANRKDLVPVFDIITTEIVNYIKEHYKDIDKYINWNNIKTMADLDYFLATTIDELVYSVPDTSCTTDRYLQKDMHGKFCGVYVPTKEEVPYLETDLVKATDYIDIGEYSPEAFGYAPREYIPIFRYSKDFDSKFIMANDNYVVFNYCAVEERDRIKEGFMRLLTTYGGDHSYIKFQSCYIDLDVLKTIEIYLPDCKLKYLTLRNCHITSRVPPTLPIELLYLDSAEAMYRSTDIIEVLKALVVYVNEDRIAKFLELLEDLIDYGYFEDSAFEGTVYIINDTVSVENNRKLRVMLKELGVSYVTSTDDPDFWNKLETNFPFFYKHTFCKHTDTLLSDFSYRNVTDMLNGNTDALSVNLLSRLLLYSELYRSLTEYNKKVKKYG